MTQEEIFQQITQKIHDLGMKQFPLDFLEFIEELEEQSKIQPLEITIEALKKTKKRK